jgi:hypothetical protein
MFSWLSGLTQFYYWADNYQGKVQTQGPEVTPDDGVPGT